jgi:tetratricopeptide (TPR) repeat protein
MLRQSTSCRPLAFLTSFSLAVLVVAASATPAQAQGKTAPAAAQTPQARAADLFNKGAEAYRRGEFQQAVTLMQEAYSLDPQPVLLYNLARAHEGLGSIDAAIDTFTRYLEADPKAPDRGAIEQRIGTLKRQRDERRALEKQRDAERTRADEEKAERERKQGQRPDDARQRSVLPYVVAGTGVAGLASGVIFGLMANSKHSSATSRSTSQQSAIDQQDTAKSFATVSTVSFIVGGVLVAAGVTWWVIDGKNASKQGTGAAPALRVGLAPGFLMLEQGFQ